MRELHLFAGIGGGILAGEMLGHTPVCAVEINRFCRKLLHQRWPNLPIYDDVRTFKGIEWRGRVDAVCGGFPCQDISSAGKGAGITGTRSGLWFEMLRVVREVEPRFVFVENSPLLRTRGLGVVLGGLAVLGFDASWDVVSAQEVGANHPRKRMWILAEHPDRKRCQGEDVDPLWEDGCDPADPARAGDVAHAGRPRLSFPEREELRGEGWWNKGRAATERGWWRTEPDLGRVAYGVPSRVDRLRSLGEAQCPLQAATAFLRLMAALRL